MRMIAAMLIGLIAASGSPSVQAQEGPVTISDSPQLFLDDFPIRKMDNLKRVIEKPTKHPANPLIVPEHPWEKRILEIYGTVLFDPAVSRYRCWYLGNEFKDGVPDNPEHPRMAEYYTCYAESEDGIRWNKPFVGREPFGRHPQHNVIISGTHGFCVLPTPDDPDPARRYKGAGGASFGFSPDGLVWDIRNWRDAIGKNDTSTCVVRWRGEYLAYVRAQVQDPQWPGIMRGVGLSTSPDFEHWTPKETVFTTDTEDGYPWTQPYGISVTPYGDVLIGILWLLHLDHVEGNNSLGSMDTQLAVSRDGRAWSRVAERQPFLVPTPGTWDAGRVFPGTTMIVKDDEVRIYYTGVGTRHGEGWGSMGIGFAMLPADRFVGLEQADVQVPGMLETVPLHFAYPDLLVNASCDRDSLQIEIANPDGTVVNGFGREHCRLLRHDALRYRIVWAEGNATRTLGDLAAAQPYVLRFIIRGGALYAFQTTSPTAAR
ncbi:MAG: hypothetical protein IT365_16320 [Candidatus Hydrogenedentes bacterium]|nr:hypothetical protein [Candidatus Hydrogenedentota bacterium]